MESISSIILAAGQGTRMNSAFPKVLHQLAGKPMLYYPIELTRKLNIKKRLLVIGFQAEKVKKNTSCFANDIIYVYQERQLGTAHAVLQAKPYLADFEGTILILSGDVPLLRYATTKRMLSHHKKSSSACTLLTVDIENPEGYGRIIRDCQKKITGIIEQCDLSEDQNAITEINTGIYCFNARELFSSLAEVNQENNQQEYYLTDIIKIFIDKGLLVTSITTQDKKEISGVNSRIDLARANKEIYLRNAIDHMAKGVTIIDPENTYIEDNVKIGRDTVVYPSTIITDGTEIAEKCQIGPYSHIVSSFIGTETKVYSSVVENSIVGKYTSIGPYSHIRPKSEIGDQVKIGNYVEIKKSNIEDGCKIGHLTYLGDASLDKNVNIGAGTITCNYDGKNKNTTTIEENVFIGSNNSLVAPVKIGKNSYTAAGSTITQDVPQENLAVARARQKNIANWAKNKTKK